MANIANVKVKPGNVLTLSGSSVEITGSTVSVSGDLLVNGVVSASVLTVSETIISSSTVYHSGNTIFGDTGAGPLMDIHRFTGSVNISGSQHSITGPLNIVGNVSGTTFTGSFSGDGSQLTNLSLVGSAVTSINAGTNLSASASTGAVTIALSSSITTGLTNLTASNISASNLLKATTLSASNAEFSGSVLIYGTASLTANPTAAYVRYEANSGSVVDKIVIFPGLYTSGAITGSVLSGSGTGITGLTASNFSTFSQDVRNQLSGSGAINYNPSTGVISSTALTAAVTQVSQGSNILVTNGSGPTVTVALTSSVTGLTNLESLVITGSDIVATSSLNAAGKFFVAQRTVTTDYTVDASGLDNVIFVDASLANENITITLPNAVGSAGRELIIKKIDSNTSISILLTGTVDGDAGGFSLDGPYQSVTLVSDGSTGWFIT